MIKAVNYVEALFRQTLQSANDIKWAKAAFARAARQGVERFKYGYAINDCLFLFPTAVGRARKERYLMSTFNKMTREWMSAIKRAAVGRVMNKHQDTHAAFLSFSVAENRRRQY
jgi:hypothetical protein